MSVGVCMCVGVGVGGVFACVVVVVFYLRSLVWVDRMEIAFLLKCSLIHYCLS